MIEPDQFGFDTALSNATASAFAAEGGGKDTEPSPAPQTQAPARDSQREGSTQTGPQSAETPRAAAAPASTQKPPEYIEVDVQGERYRLTPQEYEQLAVYGAESLVGQRQAPQGQQVAPQPQAQQQKPEAQGDLASTVRDMVTEALKPLSERMAAEEKQAAQRQQEARIQEHEKKLDAAMSAREELKDLGDGMKQFVRGQIINLRLANPNISWETAANRVATAIKEHEEGIRSSYIKGKANVAAATRGASGGGNTVTTADKPFGAADIFNGNIARHAEKNLEAGVY